MPYLYYLSTIIEYSKYLCYLCCIKFTYSNLIIKNHIWATTSFFRGLRMRKAKWCMWMMCQEDLRAVVCVLAVIRSCWRDMAMLKSMDLHIIATTVGLI